MPSLRELLSMRQGMTGLNDRDEEEERELFGIELPDMPPLSHPTLTEPPVPTPQQQPVAPMPQSAQPTPEPPEPEYESVIEFERMFPEDVMPEIGPVPMTAHEMYWSTLPGGGVNPYKGWLGNLLDLARDPVWFLSGRDQNAAEKAASLAYAQLSNTLRMGYGGDLREVVPEVVYVVVVWVFGGEKAWA